MKFACNKISTDESILGQIWQDKEFMIYLSYGEDVHVWQGKENKTTYFCKGEA